MQRFAVRGADRVEQVHQRPQTDGNFVRYGMTFCFRFRHPNRDLQLRAIGCDNRMRAIGTPRLERDGQCLPVEGMEPIANRDVRTYGIMDGVAFIRTCTPWWPTVCLPATAFSTSCRK
jgi:hypothetical protein